MADRVVAKKPVTVPKAPLARGQGNITVSAADRRSQSDIDLGEQKIDGVVYKPSVFYVLVRGNIAVCGIEIKQDFTSRIVKQALRLPF